MTFSIGFWLLYVVFPLGLFLFILIDFLTQRKK